MFFQRYTSFEINDICALKLLSSQSCPFNYGFPLGLALNLGDYKRLSHRVFRQNACSFIPNEID